MDGGLGGERGGLSDYPVWTDAAGEAVSNGIGFTAPSNAANVTVTASFFGVNESLKTKFKVFEPSGIDTNHTYKVYDYTNASTAPFLFGQGNSGAGMYIRVYVAPTYVSFYQVTMEEVGEDATNVTGYYTNSIWTTDILSHRGDTTPYGQGKGDDCYQFNQIIPGIRVGTMPGGKL